MTRPLTHLEKAERAINKAMDEINFAVESSELHEVSAYECAVALRRAADEIEGMEGEPV